MNVKTKLKHFGCYQLQNLIEDTVTLKMCHANKHLSMWQIYFAEFQKIPPLIYENIHIFPQTTHVFFFKVFQQIVYFQKKKCKEALHIHMTLTRVDDILKGKLIYVWYSTNFTFFFQ